nr:hypothetical protein [Tanacetum cinerariifolium]
MVALVISISLNVSVKSVVSSFLRVTLIGSISVEILVAPEVGAAIVSSPAEVLELDTHSSSKADPSESSPLLYLALTVRKSVKPLHSHRLALSLGHSLYEHTPPYTTDADLFTPLRFVHPPLARTLWCSEAYLRWRPSHKRCRSPAATMTSSIHATRALVPSRADLLPPCKKFRDSISPEDSVEEDIDTVVLEDIEADAMAVKVAVDRDVEAGINTSIDMEIDVGVDVEDEVEDEVESSDRGTMEVGVDVVAGIDIPDSMIMPDAVEHVEQVEEGLQDIYEHVMEIPLQRIEDIETRQRELEARSTMMMERARADRFWQRVRFIESELRQILRFRYYKRTRFRRLETFAVRRLEEALAAYEGTRATNALEAESQSQNGCDGDNGNRNGRDGNAGYGNGGNGNPNENNRDARPVARELTWWFEKMETVFHINSYLEKYQVKYATCTLLNNALTWWNSHKRTVGIDAAFSVSWRELMKLMAERFQELTMLCTKMVPEEEDQVKRYIRGLPKNIQGNVIAVEPTRLQDVVRIANNLMDQKLKGHAVKNAENKRRLERGQTVNQRVVTCFECGRQGHYKSDCLKLKDQNHGNKARNKNRTCEARGKAYVLGGGDANPDSNVIKGTFLLNNRYAFVLFDSGADRSFVLTTFSTLLDITPDTLDVSYAVELADGRISKTNTVLRGCTLGLLGHPFNIDPMPVELSCFNVIIGMDWLANHHAMIVYDEKIV